MKYWEIIARNLKHARLELGLCFSDRFQLANDLDGRRTSRRRQSRFVVHADEKLTAFLELESAPGDFADSLLSLRLLNA